jgi:hypothetical protein
MQVVARWAPLDRIRAGGPELLLFLVLVLIQIGHLAEHVVQVAQIHLLGVPAAEAHGVVGRLDIEWVHFIWNTVILLFLLLLLPRFKSNRWLVLTLVVALWHQAEHTYLIARYLIDGVGGPGLLAAGGAIAGGLPLQRPLLHFIYNLVEIAPLVAAFVWQWRRTPSPEGGSVAVSAS